MTALFAQRWVHGKARLIRVTEQMIPVIVDRDNLIVRKQIHARVAHTAIVGQTDITVVGDRETFGAQNSRIHRQLHDIGLVYLSGPAVLGIDRTESSIREPIDLVDPAAERHRAGAPDQFLGHCEPSVAEILGPSLLGFPDIFPYTFAA